MVGSLARERVKRQLQCAPLCVACLICVVFGCTPIAHLTCHAILELGPADIPANHERF
jgi:hypothetical protein